MTFRLKKPHALSILIMLTGASLSTSSIAEVAQSDLSPAWRDAAIGLVPDARRVFEKGGGREARMGRAITLIFSQPKVEKNIERSVELLTGIMVENETDDLGLMACYYLGRVEQVHRKDVNPQAAGDFYRKLLSLNPAHPLAEQALLKMAIIELYAPGLSPDQRRACFDRYAALTGELVNADAGRDLNLLLAQAGQRFRFDPNRILDCYRAADRLGVVRNAMRADVYVSVLTLARDLGQVELCREYCDKFLSEYRRDSRHHMVREIRRGLSGKGDA